MNRTTNIIIFSSVILMFSAFADAQLRTVPVTDAWGPRDEDGRPLEGRFLDVYPAAAEQFAVFKQRVSQFRVGLPEIVDEGSAGEMINELYHDTGHPALNYRWQILVLSHTGYRAGSPETPQESARALREGLLEFYEAGGAQGANGSPLHSLRLGYALAQAGFDDERALRAVGDLVNSAFNWAAAEGDPHQSRLMRNEAELMVDALEELRASERADNPGSEEDLSELIFAMDDALSTSQQAAVAQVAGAKAEDPWDRYTREFIERHKLEERRVKKAWELCGRCKDLRHRIMKENNLAKKIRQWEAIRKALDVPNSSTPALVRVDRTLRRLRAPVERIFNERLKSGLEEIARKK